MKKISCLVVFVAVFIIIPSASFAQQAFNPEYLGNAAGTGKSGFALKTFASYFYQNALKAHDIEMAFETQGWFPGFSGNPEKDQIQIIAHMPIGYRIEDTANGTRDSIFGIGSLTFNIEHFWHIIDNEGDLDMWLDHAITTSYPTAMDDGLARIGSNAYTVGAFQEMCIHYKDFLASIMPLMITWTTWDDITNVRTGLTLGILNSSLGYYLTPNFALGASYGLFLGNVAGTTDLAGKPLDRTVRAYAGPAFMIGLPHDMSLQISGIVDVYTRKVSRGQGVFLAFWHMF